MRVTTWNCCQGTDSRVPHMLDVLAPDVAVVPASARTPAIAVETPLTEPVPHRWSGNVPAKGLGVFAPYATSITEVRGSKGPGAHGLGLRMEIDEEQFGVLAIWTLPLPGTEHPSPHMGALETILARHSDLLAAGDVVVAGDFNCSGQAQPEAFPAFLTELCDRYDLDSAYHRVSGEAIGAETQPTQWLQHSEEQSCHGDFVLVPRSWTVEKVEVGSFAEWGAPDALARSDHAPLTVDVTPA